MVWNRGNQDDYNSWESLGNSGWSWTDLLPYFKKVGKDPHLTARLTVPLSQKHSPLSIIGESTINPSHSLPMHMDRPVLFQSATPTTIGLKQVSNVFVDTASAHLDR